MFNKIFVISCSVFAALIIVCCYMQAPLCQTNSAAPLATNFLVPPPQETATGGDNTSLSASTPAFRHNGMTAPNLSPLETSAFIGNRSKQLPARIKLYEFYNAPITKFWAHSVSVCYTVIR